MYKYIKKHFFILICIIFVHSSSASAETRELNVHSSQGSLQYIDDGDVAQLPNSEFFVVTERHIGGTLTGSIGGDFGAPYLITYNAYVPISTQSGPVGGTLVSQGYELYFRGQSRIAPTPVPCPTPDGVTCIETPNGNFIPGLWVDSKAYFRDGAKGKVDMTLWIIPLLDAEGHIIGIYDGQLSLNGEWRKEPWQLQGKRR